MTAKTIDHETECAYAWCDIRGLPDEHGSTPEHYVAGTLSIARVDVNGAHLPSIGAGVSWDRTEDPNRPPAVVVHIVGDDTDADIELTLFEAKRLQARLDLAIGIVAGIHRDEAAMVATETEED